MKIADNPFYIGEFSGGKLKLENTADAIASFICKNGLQEDVRILMPDGSQALDTFGLFINRCCDSNLLNELLEALIPKQKKVEEELGLPTCPCCG